MLIVFIFVTLFLGGCATKHPASENYSRVAASTNRVIKNKLMLNPWGSGVHMENRKISVYEAAYISDNYLTVDEARLTALLAAAIIKERLNNDDGIQIHLLNTPFENNNILFSIRYFNPESGSNERLCFALGTLKYSKLVPDSFDQIPLFNETYEEAVEKAGF